MLERRHDDRAATSARADSTSHDLDPDAIAELHPASAEYDRCDAPRRHAAEFLRSAMMQRKNVIGVRKIVAYARVSTEEQAMHGVSLEAQQARMQALAVAGAFQIDEMIVDAAQSAKTLKRPGMARILDGIRAGEIGTLMVLKLDRLTRSVRDLYELLALLEKYDVKLTSISEMIDTSSAAGRMFLTMLSAFSQWERETIGERTAVALTHKRSTGKAYARAVFGYRRVGERLEAVPEQQAILSEIRQLEQDDVAYNKIARMLNERGIKAPRGKQWYDSSVRAVLRSRMAMETAAQDIEVPFPR
jgi:site-specific DNA recombinase